MRDASDKLKDDDRINDGRAASTIMKNGVLIIADIWSFIDYLGNTYPSYDLSSSGHNASGGYDSGTGSSMIIPDGGNGSPSPQKPPSSPSLNSGASANDQTTIYFFFPIYKIKYLK